MEGNLPENDNVVTEKSNNSKIIIVILVVLLVGALGFICYDKFFNKEKPPVPTPTPSPTASPVTTNNDTLTTLNKVILTTENQSITIGNNSFNVRLKSKTDGGFYINDKAIVNELGNDFGVDTLYVTDKFAFFTLYGQFDSTIEYAFDSEGNAIKIDDNDIYIHDIHLENGIIVGKGMNAVKALDDTNAVEEKLVIKYENNVITIESLK